jgi:MFS transporter, DHA2 family, multidrug resistance protein
MSDVDGRRAGPREWAGLAVLSLPCMVVSMDAQVLHLAIPQLTAELRPTGAELLWVLDSYVFFGAGALLTMGTLGDRIGRRRLLLVGAAAFAFLSTVAAFAPSAGALIAARAALGVAGAALMPSTLSLIRTMFPRRRQRTTALGVWTASFSLGGILAPLVGGVLLTFFWWGSVFLVAPPIMALLLVAGPRLLPEARDAGVTRLDPVTATLSLAAVLAVVYGVKRLAEDGPRPTPVLAAAAGLALGALLVHRQRRRPGTALDPALWRCTAFTAPLATNALAFFVLYGTQVAGAQYLQLVAGLSPLKAGLCTIPPTLGYLAGSVLGPVAAARARPAYVIAVALGVAAAGFGLMTGVGTNAGLALWLAGAVVSAVGLAPVYTLTTELSIAAVPERRAGVASASVETGAELGGALGIAVLGSLTTAVYRHQMAAGTDLGGPVGDAARRTLGGAVAVAGQVRGGDRLLRQAQQAFEEAFATTAAAGAAVLAVTALLAARGLRRTARHGEPTASGAGGGPGRCSVTAPRGAAEPGQ